MIFSSLKKQAVPSRRSSARRKWKIAGLAAASIVGAGFFVAISGAGYVYVSSPTVRSVIRAVTRHEIAPDQAFPGQDAVTLLVMGADQDRDNYKRVVGKAQRSDTMMVARFDFLNQKVGIVSIPRDTKIRIPGYRGYSKINAALAFGGPELAKKTVEQFLGVTVDHTALINFDGFKKAVDLMGGVPVTVDKPLNYDDNWGDLHVHLTPGLHWLNGQDALGFVRIRKVDSDIYRAQRQQQFLRAVKGRLADPRVWLKAPALIEGARKALETDLSDSQLLCLSTFTKNLPSDGVQTGTLPGDEGPSFVTLDPKGVREMAASLLGVPDAPLTGLGERGSSDRIARRGTGDDESEMFAGSRHSRRREKTSKENASDAPDDATEEAAPPSTTDEFAAPLSDAPGASSSEAPDAAAPAEADADPGSVTVKETTPESAAPVRKTNEAEAPARSESPNRESRASEKERRSPKRSEPAPTESSAPPAPPAGGDAATSVPPADHSPV
jgi:LCP family protein required for cell wall assembly